MYAVDLIVREYVPLAPLTTLGVGGPARYFARVGSLETIQLAIDWAAKRGLPLLVLGGGSNLLVADHGFPGLVLRVAVRGIESVTGDVGIQLIAGAGENWNGLVTHTVVHGWSGIECLAGIPGRVGATPIQNVGAYGQEVSETISWVEALDLHTGTVKVFSNADCRFGYRESRFKFTEQGRYVVLRVSYQLSPDGKPTMRYAELERHLTAQGIARPGLDDVRRAVLDIRRRKSMLFSHQDPNARSAGSFFVNPIVSAEAFAVLEATVAPYLTSGEHLPGYPQADGQIKLSAAWLIERAGYQRGFNRGSVGLSSNHSLALINRGGATAREIIHLAREIRDRVYDHFGITLSPEPTFVGVSLDDERPSIDSGGLSRN